MHLVRWLRKLRYMDRRKDGASGIRPTSVSRYAFVTILDVTAMGRTKSEDTASMEFMVGLFRLRWVLSSQI